MNGNRLGISLRNRLLTGTLAGLTGLLFYLTPLGGEMEESLGLEWLFRWRGPRAAPAEVVVVALDENASIRLGLPADPAEWPRRWHAKLIDQLSEAGARFIAFDLFFHRASEPKDDHALAAAMRKAGNVGLVDFFTTHVIDPNGSPGEGAIEMRSPPQPLFADAAKVVAPFLLPKQPARVSRYLSFLPTRSGTIATLPIIGFQHFAAAALPRLLETLQSAGMSLDFNKWTNSDFGALNQYLAGNIEANPALIYAALNEADKNRSPNNRQFVRSWLRLYGNNSVYLDFYGPPRQIRTIPFDQALLPENRDLFKGAFVCVGLSESAQISKTGDTFLTVFTQANGLSLSGVEIMATAVANLLEDRSLRTPEPLILFSGTFLWGLSIGALARSVSARAATAAGLIAAGGYLWAAQRLFATQSLWLPLVTPLLLQLPLALLAGTALNNRNIQRLFEFFVPRAGIRDLVRGVPAQRVNGACFASDIENYTHIVEAIDPSRVRPMLDAYHEAIFPVVHGSGGFISDILGDALLAIWHRRGDGSLNARSVCEAVLGITEALERMNRTQRHPHLKTRFGIHSGEFFLGILGLPPHLEYRATGDVINTASRIEGLNKVLGTQILVSADTLAQAGNHFRVRLVGEFLLAGKSTPLGLFELIGHRGESPETQSNWCEIFETALASRRRGDWDQARDGFAKTLTIRHQDGPSRFYLDRLNQDRIDAESHGWNGVIKLSAK